MDPPHLMHHFRTQMSRILAPKSNTDLKEATAWIEGFRRTENSEEVMMAMLATHANATTSLTTPLGTPLTTPHDTPLDTPLSDGEVILISQSLQWRVSRMSSSGLKAINITFLVQFATLCNITSVAQDCLYLTIATYVVRFGLFTSQSSILSSFIEQFHEYLTTHAAVRILKHIPDVVTTTYIYRGNKVESNQAMVEMCANILNELPTVLSCIDQSIREVLSPMDMNASSLGVHRDRDRCFQSATEFNSILNAVQTALNWTTLYISTREKCITLDTMPSYSIVTSFCSDGNDSVLLQSEVVAMTLSIMSGLLTPSDESPERIFLDDNMHRLYKLCAEVVFSLLQTHWVSVSSLVGVTSTILDTLCTLMEGVGSYYSNLIVAMNRQPDQAAQTFTLLNEIVSQFESSVFDIAFTVLSSDCIWMQFRQFLCKIQDNSLLSQNGEVLSGYHQLSQCWRLYFISLVSFMQHFNGDFCDCNGEEKECRLFHICSDATDLIKVSESYFSSRIISVRMFRSLIVLWRGLLEDDTDESNKTFEFHPSVQFSDIFDDSSGNNVIVQGMTILTLAASIPDHACVMSHKIIQDPNCLGFAQLCYSENWEMEYGEEHSNFRKDLRDVIRIFGPGSSVCFHSLLRSKLQHKAISQDVLSGDTDVQHAHQVVYKPVFTVIWLFDCVISEVQALRAALSDGKTVPGKQVLHLEALLHAVTSLCSGAGANVLAYIPASGGMDSTPFILKQISSRNDEVSSLLYNAMKEVMCLNHELLQSSEPDIAHALPLLRLVVVLVTDMYKPVMSHLSGRGNMDSAFEELCGFTKSCCELLLQSVYVPEEFSIELSNKISGSTSCFVGAVLPFRVKQDHIGCVSFLKMTQLIKKLGMESSTRQVLFALSSVSGTNSINACFLPSLIFYDESFERIGLQAQLCDKYQTHLYTDSVALSTYIHGDRAQSTSESVLLCVKSFVQLMISFSQVKHEKLSSPSMSWRSFLILHESTITLLESLSFAVFIGRVESQCTSVNDLSLLQGEVFMTSCNHWYFPVFLPCVMLLLDACICEDVASSPSSAFIDQILGNMLNLCSCLSSENDSCIEKSKQNVLSIGRYYQQQAFLASSNNARECKYVKIQGFFELLAQSIKVIIKQSFSSLQNTLEEGNIWKGYITLYHELSVVVTLVVQCIVPLSKSLLAKTDELASDIDYVVNVMKGVNSLVVACCAHPPAILKNKSVLEMMTSNTTPLSGILNAQPPAQSSCSGTLPPVNFNHVMSCFEELFGITMGVFDMHVSTLLATDASGADMNAHFEGLEECIHSAIHIVKNLAQWPFLIGERLRVCQYVLTTISMKSFEVLGWNEGTCSCTNGTMFPKQFYVSLLSFWRCCLEFQWHEQGSIHLSSGFYEYTDIPLEQKAAIISFTLTAGVYMQSLWSTDTGKESKQEIVKFFSHFTAVLSFCVGDVTGSNSPCLLDASDGLISPSSLNSIKGVNHPCGDVHVIEYLHTNGKGMLILQILSTLFRDANCPSLVKESFIRLLMKFFIVFGTTLSSEYIAASEFSSVTSTIISHCTTGQWKKIKNVLKTLSK